MQKITILNYNITHVVLYSSKCFLGNDSNEERKQCAIYQYVSLNVLTRWSVCSIWSGNPILGLDHQLDMFPVSVNMCAYISNRSPNSLLSNNVWLTLIRTVINPVNMTIAWIRSVQITALKPPYKNSTENYLLSQNKVSICGVMVPPLDDQHEGCQMARFVTYLHIKHE